jgi:DNA-directed RNA polymerase specialized sigma24 family protein
MHQPMTQEWYALADQPDDLHVLTDAFLEMQRRVEAQETRRDSTPPNGYEEALTQIVDELCSLGRAEPNRRTVILRRFNSLCRNRSRRERSRQQQLQKLLPHRLAPPDPAAVAETNDLLQTAQARTPPDDWALLSKRAEGATFGEIAARAGASPEALRSRVCRRRAELQYLIL